jgi:hypothetical protein
MIPLKEGSWTGIHRDNGEEGGLNRLEEIGPQRGTRRREELG